MRDSVPSLRYSPICNVLRQWQTSLIYGRPEGRPHTGSSNGRSVFRVRTSAHPLGRSACPHRQSPYAMRGSALPHCQLPYAMRGSARPHRQSPYAMRGSALPHRQSPSPCEGPHFRIASRHARVRMSTSPVAMRGSARTRPHLHSRHTPCEGPHVHIASCNYNYISCEAPHVCIANRHTGRLHIITPVLRFPLFVTKRVTYLLINNLLNFICHFS